MSGQTDSVRPYSIFQSDRILNARIEADFSKLFADLEQEDWVQQGYGMDDSRPETSIPVVTVGDTRLAAKIKIRGQGSRHYCRFPKIAIKIIDPPEGSTGLAKKEEVGITRQGRINVISHCDSCYEQLTDFGKRIKEETVFREEFMYEMARILFEKNAYLTRAVRIEYVDRGGQYSMSKNALLLENWKAFVSRRFGDRFDGLPDDEQDAAIKREVERNRHLEDNELQPFFDVVQDDEQLAAAPGYIARLGHVHVIQQWLFQIMILNSYDWNLFIPFQVGDDHNTINPFLLKNTKVYHLDNDDGLISIPYDFDVGKVAMGIDGLDKLTAEFAHQLDQLMRWIAINKIPSDDVDRAAERFKNEAIREQIYAALQNSKMISADNAAPDPKGHRRFEMCLTKYFELVDQRF